MGMGFIKKSDPEDAGTIRRGARATQYRGQSEAQRTGGGNQIPVTGERVGSVTGEASDKNKRYAAFLGAVAGDCGCERCCSYRDMASTLLNPSSDY